MFQKFAQFTVVKDGEAQIEKEVDDLVASDEVAHRKPLERTVDRGDDSFLVHLALLSML